MITITMRFAVRKAQQDHKDEGRMWAARVLDQVVFIDGFPHSYTDKARELANRILVDPEDEQAIEELQALMSRDGVLRH